jgi:NCAIR mutase (PurE)-related protein
MDAESLQHLLNAVATGKVNPTDAVEKIKQLEIQTVGDFARIDHHRQLRTGFPEVIWGQDKTPDQILQIMQAMQQRQQIVMATRIRPDVFIQLQQQLPDLSYYPLAKIAAIHPPKQLEMPPTQPGKITILTAGTADLPVAEEAAITATLSGFEVQRLWDVGVAGIHRLLSHRHLLAAADVLIVVAGMEGALPSVVAGLADCPVVAVPTSVGYGASFNGLSALLTMLNSCAPGIGVVNIDNGFGAAVLAGQILRVGKAPDLQES